MENEKRTSLFAETIQRTQTNIGARAGPISLGIIVLVCAFAPLIAPYGLNEMDLSNMFKGPGTEHIFGTDGVGRDLLSRLLYGERYSLALRICTTIVGSTIGAIVGSIAKYFGGKAETIIMRFMDIWLSLPGMLLCILISAVLGAGFFNIVLALSVGNVPIGVRLIREQILSKRSKEYLEAAESINCSKISIMFQHLLPNVISPIVIDVTMGIGMTITMAATLSYIGLRVQPSTPEWGAMLIDARTHILNYPYLIMFPGLFIVLTVIAINLTGDGLRGTMDPKLRKQEEE